MNSFVMLIECIVLAFGKRLKGLQVTPEQPVALVLLVG